MTLDEQIAGALHQSATLAALVGDRIYPHQPQFDPDAPFLTFQEITIEPLPTHDTSGLDATLKTYQFSAWAATLAQAKLIRSHVPAVLDLAFLDLLATTSANTLRDPASGLYQAQIDLIFLSPV